MRHLRVALVPWFTVLGLAAACGPGDETRDSGAVPAAPQPAPEPSAPDPLAAVTEAKQVFATVCANCHGPAGAGDGPGAAGFTPPPRNFQDPEWQASVDDDHIAKIIIYGGAEVGRSPMMPAHPSLAERPEVVTALVETIRNLKR